MNNKYKVTFSYIDAYLAKWEQEEIYTGADIGEVFKDAWLDGKYGEFAKEFLDIIKIELMEENV